MSKYIFVDCEAVGPCPSMGKLTEFGAVDYKTRQTFHGALYDATPDPENPAKSIITGEGYDATKVFSDFEEWLDGLGKGRPIFISDNPAYDFQWINDGFWTTLGRNPFGHSGRRISDFYAGLMRDFGNSQEWKQYRVTPHDHNPVNDSMGNVEAFERLMQIAKEALTTNNGSDLAELHAAKSTPSNPQGGKE